MEHAITIQELMTQLTHIEELKCDGDLEIHILNKRKSVPDYMPSLKVLNGVSMDITAEN